MSAETVACPKRPCGWAFIVFFLVVFASALSIYAMRTPAPLPEDAPSGEFSAYRAIQHDYIIAAEPHPAGSPANEKVQNYLRDTMRSFGVETDIVSTLVAESHGAGQWNMVLGRIPGTSNTKAFALMAHYDSVPYGPGAADDCAGVIAMLEIARTLKASPPLKNDVIFVFTDCEEGGKLGARAFANHPWFQQTGVMANLEARGTKGNSLVFGTSEQNGWLIAQMAAGVEYPCASSLMYDIYKRMPFSSDFDELRPRGMKGFDIAFVDNFPWYHTKNDKPEHLDLGTLQQHGRYGLDMARHFGNMPLDGTLTAPDAMYFNTLGYHMVVYPLTWGTPLAIGTAILALLTLLVGRIRKHVYIFGVLGGMVAWALTAAVSAGVAVLMVAAVWGQETTLNIYLNNFTRIPDLYPLYHNALYTTAFAAASITVAALIYAAAGRWIRSQSLAMGALAWWTLLMLGVARYLPGGGYIVMWPLAFNLVGLLLCFLIAKPGRMHPGWVVFLTLCALPTLILLTPTYRAFAYTVMIMAAPGLAVYAVLMLGCLIPQLELMRRVNWWWLPGSSAAVAAVLMLTGLANSDFNTLRPKLNSVSYGIDFDTNRAFWLSPDAKADEWTRQFFPPGAARERYAEFVPGSRELVMKTLAPIVPEYPGAQITLTGDATVDNVREITFHVASPAQAPRLELSLASDTEVLGATVFGKPLDAAQRRWRLGFNLFPKEGADVTLRIPAGSSVKIKARETLYGLPIPEGFRPRPDYMTCTPNTVDHHGRALDSNRIFTTRTFEL
jgi:hypothetical protein